MRAEKYPMKRSAKAPSLFEYLEPRQFFDAAGSTPASAMPLTFADDAISVPNQQVDPSDPVDVFQFTLTSLSDVQIGTDSDYISYRLIWDLNGNGIAETSETLGASRGKDHRFFDLHITLPPGTYFVEATTLWSDAQPYELLIHRSDGVYPDPRVTAIYVNNGVGEVQAAKPFTLSAIAASIATTSSVEFFRETNGQEGLQPDSDERLGAATPAGHLQLTLTAPDPGEHIYYARAVSLSGAISTTNYSVLVTVVPTRYPDVFVNNIYSRTGPIRDTFTIEYAFSNLGDDPAPAGWTERLTLTDLTTGTTVAEATRTVDAEIAPPSAPNTSPGNSRSFTVTIPSDHPTTGAFRVTLTLDPDSTLGEIQTSNNSTSAISYWDDGPLISNVTGTPLTGGGYTLNWSMPEHVADVQIIPEHIQLEYPRFPSRQTTPYWGLDPFSPLSTSGTSITDTGALVGNAINYVFTATDELGRTYKSLTFRANHSSIIQPTQPVARNNRVDLTLPRTFFDGYTFTRASLLLDTNRNGLADPADKPLARGTPVGRGYRFSSYRFSTSASKLAAGPNALLVQIYSKDGKANTVITTTVDVANNAPTVTRFKATSTQLTANARDTDGRVTSYQFIHDANSNGLFDPDIDQILFSGRSGKFRGQFSSSAILCRAQDADGTWSAPAQPTIR